MMLKIKTPWIVLMPLAFFAAATTYAQTTVVCPPDPNLVTVKVTSKFNFDAVTKMFTYTYTISNDLSSVQEIESFNLDFAPSISSVVDPPGWVDGTFSFRSTLGWGAVDDLDRPADPADTATVPAALSQIGRDSPLAASPSRVEFDKCSKGWAVSALLTNTGDRDRRRPG
jgi:hypothetical protein